MAARKTYWHLSGARRMPSDYEIATSRLLYHVDRGGFAVDLPTSGFYERHQKQSALKSARWDDFADPRATTYTKYVNLQRDAESHLNRLLASTEDEEYDRGLAGGWMENFGRILSALRFMCHALQMAAAYVGQIAPAGRIAVAAAFQCGDEIRRVQRLAQRVAQVARVRPEVVEDGRTLWQSDPTWQPLRRVIERLLVTYDWGESLVALNVCLKPVVDDIFLIAMARRADESRDHLDAQILRSLFEDCRWHRRWTSAVLALAFSDSAANREAVARWIDAWTPIVEEFTRAAADLSGIDGPAAVEGLRSRLRSATSEGSGDEALDG
jgi:toluene monooxygenase system protein E